MKESPEIKTPAEQLLQLLLSKEKLEDNYLCYTEKKDSFTIISIVKHNLSTEATSTLSTDS
jgi:hypothetical protein